MQVKLFDTTLRDGAQTEGISFSLEDKIKIAKLLDELGVHYIEGGWPGSNPKDIQFFKAIKKEKLLTAKIVAFSSTRRPGVKVEDDKNIQTLLKAETPAVSIFGKCWDFHVTDALKTTLGENLAMIKETVAYAKQAGKEVIFDAEHFFDGFKANQKYAIECLKAATEGGADLLCLCDTNGGTLPHEVLEIVLDTRRMTTKPLGIHAHNDSECGVGVSLAAVKQGCVQVQGTMNGYGERCGNANLCSIIPTLSLKMGIDCITRENLKRLTEVSRHIAEIANLPQSMHQPFVGRSAFSHKGGIHVSAVVKNPGTYEHIKPEAVGNERRVTVSELSGVSNLMVKAKEYGVDLDKNDKRTKELITVLKQLESEGYSFEEGEASFELLLKRTLGLVQPSFELEDFLIETHKESANAPVVTAHVKIMIKNKVHDATGSGDGPVNAIDTALRKVLERIYPEIKKVKLTDYKVRVLNSEAGTAARVRVIIESADETRTWGTVGVSTNVIEASWLALVDAIEYKLMPEKK
ncbi:MAG: citramalate synthase [Candidatus Saganbacteria bacterium]|nr:citramalate synthase [Candidatus Saganbacteria bacterium]